MSNFTTFTPVRRMEHLTHLRVCARGYSLWACSWRLET